VLRKKPRFWPVLHEMGPRTGYDEEQLADLISLLRPAPRPWVTAAQELPRVGRGLDQILALAEVDAEFRQALVDDLEQAVQHAGFEPEPELVRALRRRLGTETREGR
jgi:hypothetical protein